MSSTYKLELFRGPLDAGLGLRESFLGSVMGLVGFVPLLVNIQLPHRHIWLVTLALMPTRACSNLLNHQVLTSFRFCTMWEPMDIFMKMVRPYISCMYICTIFLAHMFLSLLSGIILEKINGLSTEIVHYIVPGALPYAGTFQKIVPLEQGGLYSFAVVDAPGDGMELPDEDIVNLYLQNGSVGNFTKFGGRGPDFTHRTNFVFYAALGAVPNDFENKEAFPGTQEVRLVIYMDEYPWEIGLEIWASSDETLVWYRPPRYYAREVKETIIEIVSLPERSDNYTVVVGDTYGDGLGRIGPTSGGIRVTRTWGQELGSTSFETGFQANFSFAYDLNAQAPPTAPPVKTFSPPASSAGFLSRSITLFGALSFVLQFILFYYQIF